MNHRPLNDEIESQLGEQCPLWRFSLEFYGHAGVAQILLEAQDRSGADVNMLLFALWQAKNRRAVSSAEFSVLDEAIAGWRQAIVVPMRALRRSIKESAGASSDCYMQAKALELSCERVQQKRMYETSRRLDPDAVTEVSAEELGAGNLNAYAISAGLMLPETMVAFLAAEMRTTARAI